MPGIEGARRVYRGGCALATSGVFPWPGVVSISCGGGIQIRTGAPQDIVSGGIDAGSRFCSLYGYTLSVKIGVPAGVVFLMGCRESSRGDRRARASDFVACEGCSFFPRPEDGLDFQATSRS
ncbi:hypothetical protein ES705_28370 [subsurface metagenome]